MQRRVVEHETNALRGVAARLTCRGFVPLRGRGNRSHERIAPWLRSLVRVAIKMNRHWGRLRRSLEVLYRASVTHQAVTHQAVTRQARRITH